MNYPKTLLLLTWLFLGLATGSVFSQSADFNQDGVFDCTDIDALTTEIVAMTNDLGFDLNSDGVVDQDDLHEWLLTAGTQNIGQSYLPGDGNLDGVVDVSDFNIWNSHKFTIDSRWCAGNFSADAYVDVSDLMIWNGNKFTSSDVNWNPPPAPGSLDEMVTFSYNPESGLLSMDTGDTGINCFSFRGPNPLETMDLNSGFVDENDSRWLFSIFDEHLKWMSNETTDASGIFDLAILETGLTAEDFGEIGFMNQAFETGTTRIQIVGPNVVPEPGGAMLTLLAATMFICTRRRR